jgi:hypothetical protein
MVQRSIPVQQPLPVEKREIHNSLPEVRKPIEKIIEEVSDEDDEWSSAVPAFLRRKK